MNKHCKGGAKIRGRDASPLFVKTEKSHRICRRLTDVEWLLGCRLAGRVCSTITFMTFPRRVCITVPPQLLIPHQLVSVPRGYNVTLECFTEAHPTSLNYWTRGDSQMLHDSKKYRSENVPGSPSFKIHMKLTIFNVNDDDLGQYKCVAKNPRGETDGTIRIYSKFPSAMLFTKTLNEFRVKKGERKIRN